MDLTTHVGEAIDMSENPEVVREVLGTALTKHKGVK